MSLFDEIEKFMQTGDASINYRYVNIGGKSVYIEGIKFVNKLDKTCMIFKLKTCSIKVEGSELVLKYLDKSTCVITGEIVSVVCL